MRKRSGLGTHRLAGLVVFALVAVLLSNRSGSLSAGQQSGQKLSLTRGNSEWAVQDSNL
jgi:hypothetical protein